MATYNNYLNHQALLAPLTPYEELANRAYADLGMQIPFPPNPPAYPGPNNSQPIGGGLLGTPGTYGMPNQQMQASSQLGQISQSPPSPYDGY